MQRFQQEVVLMMKRRRKKWDDSFPRYHWWGPREAPLGRYRKHRAYESHSSKKCRLCAGIRATRRRENRQARYKLNREVMREVAKDSE